MALGESALEIKEAQAKEKHRFPSGKHSKWSLPNVLMILSTILVIEHSCCFTDLCVLKLLNSPTYNITITQVSVGGNAANFEFSAIFDSGTSFTYLNDPAYTQISETVSSLSYLF